MTRKIPTIERGISHVGECLLNLQALVRFGLSQIESAEPEEFMAMRGEWCTMMYMLHDQIRAAQDYNGEAEVLEREQRYQMEARH